MNDGQAQTTTSEVSQPGWLRTLDHAMAATPWHARVAPYFLWVLVMAGTGWLQGYAAWTWPVLYAAKCAAVAWLLWRYRRWLPEVNWRFHWAVIPSAGFLLLAWIALGWLMAGEFTPRVNALINGEVLGTIDYQDPAAVPTFATDEPTFFQKLQTGALPGSFAGLFYLSITLKLIGLTLIVPMFEELFTRSAILRGFNRWPQTRTGLIQLGCDLPGIGDRLLHTRAGENATKEPPALTEQLNKTAVGALGLCGVIVSTLIFTAGHLMRDWPAAIVCGVVWCGLLWWTNRGETKRGLGPVIWSHALVNALLWGYTLWSGDWQFL